MASEIQVAHVPNLFVYVLIRNLLGEVWDGGTFVSYVSGDLGSYAILLTQQGVSSGYYTGDFPASAPADAYSIVAYERAGASPSEGDEVVATGTYFHVGFDSVITDEAFLEMQSKLDNLIGPGSVMVNHDSGGVDALAYKTILNAGIDNAYINVYLKSDYIAGNRTSNYVVGFMITDVNGRWVRFLMLDLNTTYTLIYSKQLAYGPDRRDLEIDNIGNFTVTIEPP